MKLFHVCLCITNNSFKHQSFVYTHLNGQTVLFLVILFNIICLRSVYMSSSSNIWPLNRTRSGATTSGQSEHGNNKNEVILHIPQRSRAGASPSDGLMSYLGHSLGILIPLQRCSLCILQPLPTGLLKLFTSIICDSFVKYNPFFLYLFDLIKHALTMFKINIKANKLKE